MVFGPYPADHCFHIENSALFKSMGSGVRMAEFLLLRGGSGGEPPTIWVVEAKSGAPRPETEKFRDYIDAIRQKLTNAFALGLAARLGRHGVAAAAELPEPFRKIDPSAIGFRLVLVVSGHRKDWLPPLQEALTKTLGPTIKTWGLSPPAVAVLNEDGAEKHRLVVKVGVLPPRMSLL